MLNFDDPYKGQTPELLWRPFSSDLGGLRQLNAEQTERGNYWTIIKSLLEMNKIGERLKGKKVIEIGSGDNVDFRDFCVEHETSEYVGVDLFRTPASPPDVLGKTRIRYCKEDMFRFLERENSESAVIAGFIVFCSEMIRHRECEQLGIQLNNIIQRTALEVYRVLIPGEYLITMGLSNEGLFTRYFLEAGFIKENSSLFLKPV